MLMNSKSEYHVPSVKRKAFPNFKINCDKWEFKTMNKDTMNMHIKNTYKKSLGTKNTDKHFEIISGD